MCVTWLWAKQRNVVFLCNADISFTQVKIKPFISSGKAEAGNNRSSGRVIISVPLCRMFELLISGTIQYLTANQSYHD